MTLSIPISISRPLSGPSIQGKPASSDSLVSIFCKWLTFFTSLQNGDESTCNIEEVKELQAKVLKIANTVEVMSKKIENLDANGDRKTERLQDRIRQSAKNFVKETFVGLPKVPTKEELAQIRALKAQEATRRIEEEKKSALEAKLKSESMKKSRQYSNQAQNVISNAKRQLQFSKISKNPEMKLGSGFVAKAGQEIMEDDPIGQQIHNLKVFIQQAREAGRYEDAKTLETNLAELQEEYHKQNEQLQQNYEEFKGLFAGKNKRESDDDGDESNPFFEAEKSSNPFEIEDESAVDEYDKSGKNPFA